MQLCVNPNWHMSEAAYRCCFSIGLVHQERHREEGVRSAAYRSSGVTSPLTDNVLSAEVSSRHVTSPQLACDCCLYRVLSTLVFVLHEESVWNGLDRNQPISGVRNSACGRRRDLEKVCRVRCLNVASGN